MESGISGAAVLRAASAMLKALGGDEVALLLPATATPGDVGGQLGLVDPGVQAVMIRPVMARALETDNLRPRRRIEFTLPAAAVTAQLSQLGFGTTDALFDAALGLMYGTALFHIERVTPESFAGTDYMFKVVAVE
jgi:hypothetical protein